MICPKCSYRLSQPAESCPACGVIFAKLHARPQPAAASVEEHPAGTASGLTPLAELIWGGCNETPGWLTAGRGLLWLVLLIWGGKLVLSTPASNAAGESLLHLVNLPFHEAGHIVFRPFGQFITTLGGSLNQVLVPLICLLVLLLKTRDPFGASVCLWWFGENLIDLAPYINDARTGILPLVGGNTGRDAPYGFHDWEYLLTETHLLRLDHQIAWLAHIAGALLMLTALVWGGMLLYRAAANRATPAAG